jgi:hypothetical protein
VETGLKRFQRRAVARHHANDVGDVVAVAVRTLRRPRRESARRP